jgi:hypothetical protein
MAVGLLFAVMKARDRAAFYDAMEICSQMRFHQTPASARAIGARSGGIVEETPSGFRVRFERHYYSRDVGCVVAVDGDKVAGVDLEWFDRP